MSSVPGDLKIRLAHEFLARAAEDLAKAKRTRVAYAAAAREHGLTNVEIGSSLGISEGAVRKLLKRSE